jgi:hypothetical protein
MKLWTKAAVECAACGVAFGVVLVIGGPLWQAPPVAVQAPAVPDVVRARRFELVDAAGKPRAELAVGVEGIPVHAS